MFRIKEVREARNMTQEELASHAGVTRSNISRYETGDRIPPSDVLVKIAIALSVPVDDLVIKEEVS